jgi:alkylhydroperoxidase family enzyme
LQGGTDETLAALRERNLHAAPISPAERTLLQYVQLLTETPWKATSQDAQRLREAGWSDPQIAEGVYITALFAFFNRVADAFGLEDPGYVESMPKALEKYRKPSPGKDDPA